jgi:K+-sensing histidine kinase KdpD
MADGRKIPVSRASLQCSPRPLNTHEILQDSYQLKVYIPVEILYNTQLMGTSEISEKKFSILKEISSAIIASEDTTAIANLMLDLAISHTGAENGSLMLANNSDELYVFAARGIDAGLAGTYREKIGEGIAGTVARNRRAAIVADIDTDELFKGKKRDHYRTKSFISCPVLSKEKLLGVLNINDKKNGSSFSEDELILLQTIANQAAIVLENTFLLSQLRARAAELQEINRMLIESDVVKTEFITRISHDLRTPLNSIKGSIYYLQVYEKHSNPEQREFYEIIAQETSLLINTVEKLTNFVRNEDEIGFVRKSMISLTEILTEAADQRFVKSALARKNLTLVLDTQGCKAEVYADRIRAIQLFIYLIEALSHYLKNGDGMRVTVTEDKIVKVTLTIPGRSSALMQPFLFSPGPFFFSESEEEELKLHLAVKLSVLLGWEITAEKDNSYLRITISIPIEPAGA